MRQGCAALQGIRATVRKRRSISKGGTVAASTLFNLTSLKSVRHSSFSCQRPARYHALLSGRLHGRSSLTSRSQNNAVSSLELSVSQLSVGCSQILLLQRNVLLLGQYLSGENWPIDTAYRTRRYTGSNAVPVQRSKQYQRATVAREYSQRSRK